MKQVNWSRGMVLVATFSIAAAASVSCKSDSDSSSSSAPKMTLEDFFPEGKIALPKILAASTWGQPEAELYKAVPAFNNKQDFVVSGTPIKRVARDTSFGGLYAFRVSIHQKDFSAYLEKRWGAADKHTGLMATEYHWRNAEAGVRAKLEEEMSSEGQRWDLEYYQYVPTSNLFPKGPVAMPGDLAKASVGMTKTELIAAVPGFKTDGNYYDIRGGFEDVRFWYQLDGEKTAIKGLTITFGGSNTLKVLTAAWGAPQKDGSGRPHWVNATTAVTVDGEAGTGLRATLLVREDSNDSLQFTAEAKGDYSEY